MAKFCIYIAIDNYKALMWHIKTSEAKTISNMVEEAIDWFDPELHGPFLFTQLHRISRVVDLDGKYMEAIETYAEGFAMSNTKTVSTILWLYINNNAEQLTNTKLKKIHSVLPMNISKRLMPKDKENFSQLVCKAIDLYVDEGKHLIRKVIGSRERGTGKQRVNVYLNDKTKEKLLEAANVMHSKPQHIAADALSDFKGETSERKINW